MKNKDIIKILSSMVTYMELLGENDFKIKSYSNAIYNLERINQKLAGLELSEIEQIDGVGKSIAQSINEINKTGTYAKLEELQARAPIGLKKLLKLRGIGAKKLRTLWQDAAIVDAESLEKAISDGILKNLKGFGDKTIKNISEILEFAKEVEGFIHYSDAENLALVIKQKLKNELENVKIVILSVR